MGKQRRIGILAVLVIGASACLPGPDVRISTVAGDGGDVYDGDGQPAVEAGLRFPNDVDIDAAGNLYIADSGNRRVRRVDAVTGIITTVAGTGATGYNGDGIPATTATLRPEAIALDDAGNLFIADLGNHRIRRVDAITGLITTVAGNGGAGGWDEEEAGLPATEVNLQYPTGVDVDAAGNLYIVDSSPIVRRVDAVTGAMTRVAGDPDAEEDEWPQGTPATDVALYGSRYVTVADDGTLYFDGDEEVLRVDGDTGLIWTHAGTGAWGFGGDGGPATAAEISHPNEVVLDDAGNAYLADGENGRVRVIAADTGTIFTVAGTGEWGFNGDDRSPSTADLAFPTGLAIGPDGSLYVADSSNQRIRKITVGGAIGGTVSSGGTPVVALTVELYAGDDLTTPVATTETGAGGRYGFAVPPGTYRLRFVGNEDLAEEWWDDASTGASSTPATITPGALLGPSDQVVANASLAPA